MKNSMLHVVVDRPIGYSDDKHDPYPINYGYLPNILGGDNEPQDVYIISEEIISPISVFDGKLIAIIHREDDIEDKWVVTTLHESFTVKEIADKVKFMEQYFNSIIELL